MKVQVNQNTRGFETMEKGRKVRGQDKFHVKLTDNQKEYMKLKHHILPKLSKNISEMANIVFSLEI